MHFVSGLVNAGFAVDLVTPGDGLLPVEEMLYGARVLRLPSQPEDNFLGRALDFGQGVMAFCAAQAAAGISYDFAHYRSIWSGFLLEQEKGRFGYKTIFEVNGLPSVELKYHYPGISQTDLPDRIRQQELSALALCDAVVCPADVTRSFLTSLGVERSKITVIPNGISPSDFSPSPLPAPEGRRPVILYVGTLADWQGLEVLIRAMPLILAQTPALLRLVGPGRSRQRKILQKMVRKLGLEDAVEIGGAVPHHAIAEAISAADICAAPLGLNDRNIVQGCCPIKVIEYMACGRPVVASNLPVVRELLREGQDGLLFFPDDPQDLAAQICRLIQDRPLAARLAASAAERAQTKFTWHAAQNRLLRVYSQLDGRS